MKPTRLQVKHFSFFFSLQENSLFWHFDVTEFAAIIQNKWEQHGPSGNVS